MTARILIIDSQVDGGDPSFLHVLCQNIGVPLCYQIGLI
jgi:hypothetical protein